MGRFVWAVVLMPPLIGGFSQALWLAYSLNQGLREKYWTLILSGIKIFIYLKNFGKP